MKAILCFGDSITFGAGDNHGWAGRLENYFEPKGGHHAVYNLGIPGDNSDDLLKRFNTEAKARIHYRWPEDEYLILISIGANDAKGVSTRTNYQVKPEKFKQNLRKLISLSKKHTKNVVLIGPTPVNEDLTAPYEERYYLNDSVKIYNKIIRNLCKENKLQFIDILSLMLKKNYKKLLDDGLHPNSKGYDFMFQIIKKRLSKWLK